MKLKNGQRTDLTDKKEQKGKKYVSISKFFHFLTVVMHDVRECESVGLGSTFFSS